MIPSMIWDVCHKIWACHGWKNGRSASSNYSKKNTSGFIFKKQTLRWCIEGESFPPGRRKTSWIHLKHRWCSMVMARNLPAGNDAILGVLGSRMPCPIWQQTFKLTNKFQLTCFFRIIYLQVKHMFLLYTPVLVVSTAMLEFPVWVLLYMMCSHLQPLEKTWFDSQQQNIS